jgi:hypothetical protein
MIAYISGPYRAPSIRGVQQNIERASDVAFKYWHKGYAVISPHKNTNLFDGEDDADLWIKGDLEILSKCDVIVMMKGWEKSEGARMERDFAKRNKINIIYE